MPNWGELFLAKVDSRGDRRPLVIVSHDILNRGNCVLAVPFYSQQLEKRSQQEWCVLFYQGEGVLLKNCVAKTDEITLLDKSKIDLAHGSIGKFDAAQMKRIQDALKWTLKIE